jgi:DNA-directed RNA polymerase subunit beta'
MAPYKPRRKFDKILMRLASPERILEWSHGEVIKPETINYRTQRSEKGGLFDEKIFGPEKDFECYCGKYRGIRYKGIVCEKCSVEVTRSIVRRERMGHIELASPVAHIWFLRSIPSRIALLLGVTSSQLERVIYFAGYIVTSVDEEERARLLKDLDSEYKSKVKGLQDDKSKDKLKEAFTKAKKEIQGLTEGMILDDVVYDRFSFKYSSLFEAGIGAEAVYEIFKGLDLKKLLKSLEKSLEDASAVAKVKLQKRIAIVRSMINSGVRPEWMFMTRIPVLPPALRPMVALEGGRHATSDVNDLYRRVINRNNRLKKLLDLGAPNVILRNEKRILQEAVDALIDNSIKRGSGAMNQSGRRPLKSLADNLKGKQGLFRSNLLGKRVDYSARSVIVVGPDLKLDQCGLPKDMALELFRPFVISKILEKEIAFNIRGANKLIDEQIPEVWSILEEVIQDKYVLLNRAPTLHRLGIQAFRPVLVEGKSIHIHPLVCTAFNADFDGDQMAVHVPLSIEAQKEAKEIMASDKNLLLPGSGEPVISINKLDIILGCFWMTKVIEEAHGEGKAFPSPNNAITAKDFGIVDLRAMIKVLPTESVKYQEFKSQPFETTVGRLLFNSVLPSDYPYINAEIDKSLMADIVNGLIEKYDLSRIPSILDKIKAFGFNNTTASGITFGMDDLTVPSGKDKLIKAAKSESEEVTQQYNEGLLSEEEKYRKNIEIWHGLRNSVQDLIPDTLDTSGSVYDMWKSGARGTLSNITNMVGLKGLIAGSAGRTIEFPILSSSKEGLSPTEYFITTHGSRKGLGDTALNTAKSGYLTRRLFDVSQDVVVLEDDCKSKEGLVVKKENLSGIEISLVKNISGRFLAEDVSSSKGKVLFKKGDYISKADARAIEEAGTEEVVVRSPMTCKTMRGVCVKCYGRDLGKSDVVEIGEAVGTVAAQACGEPATQLTMRTFHAGGTAIAGGDIVSGLPRVEELFECRPPKNSAVVSHIDGVVTEMIDVDKEKMMKILPEGGEKSANKRMKKTDTEYVYSYRRISNVKVGDEVKKGQVLTDGSVNLSELFKYAGKRVAQNYIISEISKIYELQGVSVARKHLEVIIRQMFDRMKITDMGDTKFSLGDIIEEADLTEENERVKSSGKDIAKANSLIKGITEVALSRKSILSAASFQNTTRVLIKYAIQGAEDKLVGLKENVILGNLIPAGTGFAGSPKAEMIAKLQEEMNDNIDSEEE